MPINYNLRSDPKFILNSRKKMSIKLKKRYKKLKI